MVIPLLAPRVNRVALGWDPVTKEYARKYADGEWEQESVITATLDSVEAWCGPLAGKRALDLGAGPGQFSVAMALRGANVTWHDPSRIYQAITSQRASAAGVTLVYSLGYLEEASRWIRMPFDLLFTRICWYYCVRDRSFAHLVHALVAPGGSGYIDLNTESFASNASWRYRTACWVNRHTGFKLAYVHPPHGRVAAELNWLPLARMLVSYERGRNDTLLFTKPRCPPRPKPSSAKGTKSGSSLGENRAYDGSTARIWPVPGSRMAR